MDDTEQKNSSSSLLTYFEKQKENWKIGIH